MSVGYKILTESLILNHSEPEAFRGREVFDIFRGRLFFETTQVFPVVTKGPRSLLYIGNEQLPSYMCFFFSAHTNEVRHRREQHEGPQRQKQHTNEGPQRRRQHGTKNPWMMTYSGCSGPYRNKKRRAKRCHRRKCHNPKCKSSPKSAPEGAKREIPSPSFGLSEVEKENLDPRDPKALQQEKYVQDGSTNAPPWWLLTMMVTGGNAHSFVPWQSRKARHKPISRTHKIHVWYIFIYRLFFHKIHPNVGKYTIHQICQGLFFCGFSFQKKNTWNFGKAFDVISQIQRSFSSTHKETVGQLYLRGMNLYEWLPGTWNIHL